jgi:hypothetical protein
MGEITTRFTDGTGARGYLTQGWDPDTATYTMIDALMTPARWIEHTPPLVEGKGVPAFAYMTMRLMKLHGIRPGEIQRLVIGANHHVESVVQLELRARDGEPLDEAVTNTTSFLSVKTPMTQSYHVVTGVQVTGGRRAPIAELLDWHARGGSELRREIARDRSAEHVAVLARLGVTPADIVLIGYETHVALEPN